MAPSSALPVPSASSAAPDVARERPPRIALTPPARRVRFLPSRLRFAKGPTFSFEARSPERPFCSGFTERESWLGPITL